MRVSVKKLHDYCVNVLGFLGMPDDEAEIFSEILIQADQRGVKSHGVMAFMRYVGLIEKGIMQKKASHTAVVDNPIVAVWDAHSSCAHVTGYYAMQEAINKAIKYGIGFVGVRNSNHFGAGAYYSKQAADAGMIGLVNSTAGPTMAPWGGTERLIGNSPLSVSVPTDTSPTVTLDMAMSTVAFGRITNIKTQRIKNIPEGWAFDKLGNETTVTDEAETLIPVGGITGGYKGFGLAFIIEIMSAILIGGPTGLRGNDDAGRPSHIFVAIDPTCFGSSLEEFTKVMEERIAEFKNGKKKEGVSEILMPGEIEEINYLKMYKEVEVIDEVVYQLNALAERLGCSARVD